MKNDHDLRKDILAELEWEPSVAAGHIGVTAHGAVVTLKGDVSSYAEKKAAETAAKRVRGVKAVANELVVELPTDNRRTDDEVAQACIAAFKGTYCAQLEKVNVVVDRGWVTLEGELEWQYEREAAVIAVRSLTGVTGVTNLITVKPRVFASDVQRRIEQAFQRRAQLGAERVNVETHNGAVVLRGTVSSLAELDQAQHAAWSAPGVVSVDNQLEVSP